MGSEVARELLGFPEVCCKIFELLVVFELSLVKSMAKYTKTEEKRDTPSVVNIFFLFGNTLSAVRPDFPRSQLMIHMSHYCSSNGV